MGTVTTTNRKAQASCPNAYVNTDSVAVTNADIDAADIVKLCFVPGGTEVHRVITKTTELDSNASPSLTAKIGFTPADGSTAVSGADTAIKADGAWGQNAETLTYDIFPPYRVEKDSYLTIVFGTGAATEAAAGTIYAKVEGEPLGIK